LICLNENYTIKPEKMKDYILHFKTDLTPIMDKYGFRLLGLFQTWRQNELWAFWEADSTASLDPLDKAMVDDRALVQYTRDAEQARLHWISRWLIPTKCMPDLATVKKEKIKGEVYQIAILPIDPTRTNEWLDLFYKIAWPLEEKYGLHTIGYWKRGGGEPYQFEFSYCMKLSAVKNWAHFASKENYGWAMEHDPEVKAWWAQSLPFRGHHRGSNLLPVYLPY